MVASGDVQHRHRRTVDRTGQPSLYIDATSASEFQRPDRGHVQHGVAFDAQANVPDRGRSVHEYHLVFVVYRVISINLIQFAISMVMGAR